jgi:hypothetical protein
MASTEERIRAFMRAVDGDRLALPCPDDLGKGWTAPGSINGVEGARVLRFGELA